MFNVTLTIALSGEELLCARVGIIFKQRFNALGTNNVTSWIACSNICREREDCLYWNWRTENSSYPNRCITMTGYGDAEENANNVSGDRNCGVTTTTTTTTTTITTTTTTTTTTTLKSKQQTRNKILNKMPGLKKILKILL